MPSPVAELLAGLAHALRTASARWYLFGAQAALLHGASRFTADVDVTVQLADEEPHVLVNALAAAGFEMRVAGVDFIQQTRVLPALHTPPHSHGHACRYCPWGAWH